MAVNIKKKESTETVTVEKTTGLGKDKEVETLKDETTYGTVASVIGITADQLANVGMSAGFTHGMPNYSNVKATVSLYLPCHIDDVDETFEKVNEWVTNKLDEVHTDFVGGQDE